MAIFVSPFLVFACFKMKKNSFLALGFFMLGLNFAEFHEIGGSRISNFLFQSFFGGFQHVQGFNFGFGCAK